TCRPRRVRRPGSGPRTCPRPPTGPAMQSRCGRPARWCTGARHSRVPHPPGSGCSPVKAIGHEPESSGPVSPTSSGVAESAERLDLARGPGHDELVRTLDLGLGTRVREVLASTLHADDGDPVLRAQARL